MSGGDEGRQVVTRGVRGQWRGSGSSGGMKGRRRALGD